MFSGKLSIEVEMKIALLTNEYPPHVYGGAGVHVEYLSRELAKLAEGEDSIRVFCFGEQELKSNALSVDGVHAELQMPTHDRRHLKLFDTLYKNLYMVEALQDIDIVHCHTWYTHFAGCLAKQMLHVPLVLTTHSLEPHRPWKEEQLGTGYQASTWIESTAYRNADGVIAVSRSMQGDVESLYGVPSERIRVIHNGIDLDQYKPSPNPALLRAHGINPNKPFILFVGRITRQKGITHFVNAIKYIRSDTQVVLCAGLPDTEAIGREMAQQVEHARERSKSDIIWLAQYLSKEEVISLYTHAAVFVCPSVYEPFGIINLEAMACGTPVVASAVGGIVEVVDEGKTGRLVSVELNGNGDSEPRQPDRFARDLASAVDSLLSTPQELEAMGTAARKRVEKHFSWTSIASKTLQYYKDLAAGAKPV